MHVYDITGGTFDRFAEDLIKRLEDLKQDRPTIWVSVGNSGAHVTQAIAQRMQASPPDWMSSVHVVQLGWDPDRQTHQLQEPSDGAILADAAVLMIDSVVNSGSTMLGAHEFITGLTHPPRSVIAYAVAVRQNADFVPNLFAFTIGASDRVFLPWHAQRPNNRLTMGGIYRSLHEKDLARRPIKSGQDFMDRVLWSDRWYTLKREADRRILVCEVGQTIAAFINFTIDPGARELHVDEIATEVGHTGNGIAGALLRYAETLARASACTHMSLWAHESVVSFYKDRGFRIQGGTIRCGEDGEYALMLRALGSSKSETTRPGPRASS